MVRDAQWSPYWRRTPGRIHSPSPQLKFILGNREAAGDPQFNWTNIYLASAMYPSLCRALVLGGRFMIPDVKEITVCAELRGEGQEWLRKAKMEKNKSRGSTGNGALLVEAQRDHILFTVIKDKPRSGTQNTIWKASIVILKWPKYILLGVSPS